MSIPIQQVCVLTTPNDPWIGELVENKGDVLIVRSEDGIEREIAIHECELLDLPDPSESQY